MRPATKLPISAVLSSLSEAKLLSDFTARMYSGGRGKRSIATSKSIEESRFREAFNPVFEEFKAHRALNHPFFDYLRDQSKDGFNSAQFDFYRANFLYRTELTIPSVARAIEKASLSGDLQTVADTVRNIYDEGGYGDPEKIHSKLLLDSHNEHGFKVFGLPRVVAMRDVKRSPLLIPEVSEYRRSKIAVFTRPYPFIAGNTWAHELAADEMLVNFREAFFEPYKGYYTDKEYDKLIEFYKAHKDDEVDGGDVEAQHERMARGAAERSCKENIRNIPKMRGGGIEFLDRQADLWNGFLREMENLQTKGGPIKPKTEFLNDKTAPRSRPKSASARLVADPSLSVKRIKGL